MQNLSFEADNLHKESWWWWSQNFNLVQVWFHDLIIWFVTTDVCCAFSEYSEPASFYTSGSVPSQPDPPMLSEPFTTSLIISWIKHPNEDSFQLQMDDESTVRIQRHANSKPLNQAPSMPRWTLKYMYIFFWQGHGFIAVYNGPNLSYKVKNLLRNTEYKFRVSSLFSLSLI